MELKFEKYQGTGNDFIMLDNRSGTYDFLSIEHIRFLCDRKFGIGADGLIKINANNQSAFEVDYYNADGSKSFCGNGARCAVNFAATLGVDVATVQFMAIDGIHQASKLGNLISLKMLDVTKIEQIGNDYVLHTGSPHYIRFVDNSLEIDVVKEGRKIRYAPTYQEEGINVNFVEELSSTEIEVSTYERGVEDETLSCGTGVTAAALAVAVKNNLFGWQQIHIHTKGGKLEVHFQRDQHTLFSEITLVGPAVEVYHGSIEITV